WRDGQHSEGVDRDNGSEVHAILLSPGSILNRHAGDSRPARLQRSRALRRRRSCTPVHRGCSDVRGLQSCAGAGRLVKISPVDIVELRAKIRDIKDFPTEGILFKDITTLLKDAPAFRAVLDLLAERYARERVDVVVGIESRGFIFGGALAHELQAGVLPLRQLRKPPGHTVQ